MVGDTFGIQFEPYDTHNMIFLETEWNKVKEENRTYLNLEYKMLEEEEFTNGRYILSICADKMVQMKRGRIIIYKNDDLFSSRQ